MFMNVTVKMKTGHTGKGVGGLIPCPSAPAVR